jgi:phosphoribosylaminoimidazole-succinocarboxamide synthase
MCEVLYEGKSKLICRGEDDNSILIRYKDTATAFNGEKKKELDGKGRINAEISNILYEYLAENGVKTHMITVVDDTSILVLKAQIIMVEVIIRNIAAGSFSKKYGVPEGTTLKNIIVEFCLKSDMLGDPMINESQITAIGIATKEELEEMSAQALKINKLLYELFERIGIRLVDFKLEFGRVGGEILLCDEITPDSCRLWDLDTGKKLDKDIFRHDLGNLLDGYSDVLRRLKNVR